MRGSQERGITVGDGKPGSHWRATIVFAMSLLLSTSCASQSLPVTHEPLTLRLAVVESCETVVDLLVDGYVAQRPWVTIDTEVFNDDVVRERLKSENVDLALLTGTGQVAASDWWETPWYQDGIAVVVNPLTPAPDVSMTFLHEVYIGRIQEWDGTVLAVVSRESGSGVRWAFDRAVLGDQSVTLTAVVMPTSRGVIEYVGRTPGAVGYISTFQLSSEDLGRVRLMPVDGVLPDHASVTQGTYPLARQLVLASRGEPTGEAREFAQWLLGSAGQKIAYDHAGWD